MTEQTLRLFVSSPGDVPDERRRIDLVAERLNVEFEGRARIETVRWETSYYSAHDTFQKQIPEAAACELVVAIFRARLGTPLPAGFQRLPSGEPYPSGTAFEVLSAIEARKAGRDLPDIYVFRCPNAPSVPLDAPDRAETEAEWERLKGFFDTWFHATTGEFIAAFQSYTSTDDFAAKVEDCLRQWLARRGLVAPGPVWDRVLLGSPFPGLAAFEADRGSVFFGRDMAIAQAIERLRQAGAAGGDRMPFLLVIGASGSGKSSLLRAGLLPRLTLPGIIPEIDLWRTAIVTPGRDPFLSLAESLFADAALGAELRHGMFGVKELLARQLRGDLDTAIVPLRDALDRAALRRQSEAHFDAPRPARLALAVDQAERLFFETDAHTAAAFAELLAELLRRNLAYLIVALRSDAYANFQAVEGLVDLRGGGATFDLVAPTAAELEEIVTRPVAACLPPLAFERKDGRMLASQLVTDAKGGDALPLLQLTLSRLYAAETLRGDGLLRFADYHGMDVAVTETANEALETLVPAARAELPALVAALVADVVTDPLTGAPAPVVVALDRQRFEAGKPARAALIEAFVGKRLLTTEGDGVSRRVRPVHEALLRIWPQAVTIVADVAQLIRVRHTLEPMVREWLAANESARPGHLELSPALVDGAQRLLARFDDDLPPPMRDFITQAASVDALRRDRERQEQERRIRDAQALAAANRRIARRTLAGLGVALVLLAVAVGVTIYAQLERTKAEIALGRSLWGELDFGSPVLRAEEVDVLWQVATASDPIHSGFIAPLTSDRTDPGVVLRFARRPDAVLRAIGVDRLSPAEARATLAHVLAALCTASDPGQIQGLALAAAALPARASADQLAQPLAAILKSLADPANFARLQELASALQAMADALSPAQAEDAQKIALAALMLTTSSDQVGALDTALSALAPRLDPGQAERALSGVLQALRSTADAHQIAALANVARALAKALSPAQAESELRPFVDSLRGTMDPVSLDAIARAVQAMIDMLRPEQAAAEYPAALDALTNPTDYGHLQAMGQAVLALARKLPAEQAAPALDRLLTALSATTDPDQEQAVALAVQALAGKLAAAQAERAETVLAASIIAATDAPTLKVMARAWQAMPGAQPTREAAAATLHVLDLIPTAGDADALANLAQAIQALPPPLSSRQASAAVAPLVSMLRRSTDPAELASLVLAAHALAGKLPADVANTVQEAVNALMTQAADPDQVAALAETLQALGRPLDAGTAGRDMAILLKALADTTDPDQRQAVAIGIRSMAMMLAADEAAADLQPVLVSMAYSDDAASLSAQEMALSALLSRLDQARLQSSLAAVLQRFADATSSAQRAAEAAIITAMSDRLSPQQVADMAAMARWRLAGAGSEPEAAAWADTIVALARLTPDSEAATLMNVLKYPTAAGLPTRIFLFALYQTYPQTADPRTGPPDVLKSLAAVLSKGDAARAPVRPVKPMFMLSNR